MKQEHERLEKEKLIIIERETKLLKETQAWKEETNAIRVELKNIKNDEKQINEIVDKAITDKLSAIDGNPHKNPDGSWNVRVPYAV